MTNNNTPSMLYAMRLFKHAPIERGDSVLCISSVASDVDVLRCLARCIAGPDGYVLATTADLMRANHHRFARKQICDGQIGFRSFDVVLCPPVGYADGRAQLDEQVHIWLSCLALRGSLVMTLPRASGESWGDLEVLYHSIAGTNDLRRASVNSFPVEDGLPTTRVDIKVSIMALRRKIRPFSEIGEQWGLWAQQETRERGILRLEKHPSTEWENVLHSLCQQPSYGLTLVLSLSAHSVRV